MGNDNDLAARMARMHIPRAPPPTISSEPCPSVPAPSHESVPPAPPQHTQQRHIVNEAFHTLTDEELNAQMQMRQLAYNETTARAQTMIQLFRYDCERASPKTQQLLVIAQTLPPR